MRPLPEVAREFGLPESALVPYGRHAAKLDPAHCPSPKKGKLVLVTGMTPTPSGEGKTTTTIGLVDGLRRLGVSVAATLRQASQGPLFGVKGGASGGGKAILVPSEHQAIHLTGDFHAITQAHNLAAAFLDNHLQHGNKLGIDPRRITFPRVTDLNDRALRHAVIGMGGTGDGIPRETRWEITPASEVMAVLALSKDMADLRERLARIVVGRTKEGTWVRLEQLGCVGAMATLLRDAVWPNLVQTGEGTPVLLHAGPFANIAHGCSSIIADKIAMGLADVVCTEAGFGADLGAEKFVHIKCAASGVSPHMAVMVATCRALRSHGDKQTVKSGAANLQKQIENVMQLGIPVVVAVNRFPEDTDADLAEACKIATDAGAKGAAPLLAFERGGEGGMQLAEAVKVVLAGPGAKLAPLYAPELPLLEKMRNVARAMYGADDVEVAPAVRKQLAALEEGGFGRLPVCMAKTPLSFTCDPTLLGRPTGFTVPLEGVRLSAGAGFVTALLGDVNLMPGLPAEPRGLQWE